VEFEDEGDYLVQGEEENRNFYNKSLGGSSNLD